MLYPSHLIQFINVESLVIVLKNPVFFSRMVLLIILLMKQKGKVNTKENTRKENLSFLNDQH